MNRDKHKQVWALDAYTFALGQADKNGRIQAFQVAGAGARYLAAICDLGLQVALGAGFYFALLYTRPDFLQVFKPIPWLIPAVALEWHVIYFLLFEAFTWGRTPGKALVRIKVVELQALARPTTVQLLTRNLMRLIDWLPLHYLAGLVSTLAGPLRMRLGDRLAGTVVIYQPSLLEQLSHSGVSDSNYSTSDDGYLLEAFLKRYSSLQPDHASFLARDLARYLHRKYAPEDAILQRLFELEKWHDYLLELYQVEKHASVDPAAPEAGAADA